MQSSIVSFFSRKRKVSDETVDDGNNDDHANQASSSTSTEPTTEQEKTDANERQAKVKALKRGSEFKEDWKRNRPWLKYVKGEGM